MSLFLPVTRNYCLKLNSVHTYQIEVPCASFLQPSLVNFSFYFILVAIIYKQSSWGRGAQFRFMVYGLLNVSLLNPFISLDYFLQANFPSFHHENGLPAKKPLITAQVHLAFPDCQLLQLLPLKGLQFEYLHSHF